MTSFQPIRKPRTSCSMKTVVLTWQSPKPSVASNCPIQVSGVRPAVVNRADGAASPAVMPREVAVSAPITEASAPVSGVPATVATPVGCFTVTTIVGVGSAPMLSTHTSASTRRTSAAPPSDRCCRP